jgi:pimeloyl-ACP methyl ester carboxylesterase/SAM-dependent methyltransferase
MYVEASGDPESPAVVFIHGSAQSARIWRAHMTGLSDFHCLAPDLPGFGRSNHLPAASLWKTADIVAALIGSHVPSGRASVVGLCSGGVVVHALLDRHPDRVERAITDGVPVIVPRGARALMLLATAMVTPFIHTRPVIRGHSEFRDEEEMRAASRRAYLRSIADTFRSYAATGASCPTLLVAGEEETNDLDGLGVRASNAALAAVMQDAEAWYAPGLGHGWQLTAPDLHVRMVEAWLTGQEMPTELRPEAAPSPEAIERMRAKTRRGARSIGYRRRLWGRMFGEPRGALGWVGARVMEPAMTQYTRAMAAALPLQPDDALLDVGCGSGRLLAEHAAHVRYVAGLDISEIQVGLARERLSSRIAAGTAEVVLGDAADLPWEDGRFSVVTSLEVLKHSADPEGTLREMYRVLRPGGRAVFTMGEYVKAAWGGTDESGARNAWGVWNWSDADAQRLVEEAGFVDVDLSLLPVAYKSRLVRASKPAASAAGAASEATESPEAVAT